MHIYLSKSPTNLLLGFLALMLTICPPKHVVMLTTRSPALRNTKFVPIVTMTVLHARIYRKRQSGNKQNERSLYYIDICIL